jgi:hypothetical protein
VSAATALHCTALLFSAGYKHLKVLLTIKEEGKSNCCYTKALLFSIDQESVQRRTMVAWSRGGDLSSSPMANIRSIVLSETYSNYVVLCSCVKFCV